MKFAMDEFYKETFLMVDDLKSKDAISLQDAKLIEENRVQAKGERLNNLFEVPADKPLQKVEGC